MIELHYSATPNGQKVAIMLEECGFEYCVVPYDIFEGDQLSAEFGAINPNHKLPAIVDRRGGDPVAVFESGAVLQYLAEEAGTFIPRERAARAQVLSWLTWQVAGLGPMGGQASHFLRYAPDGEEYAIERYTGELNRLLAVLEKRLSKSPYVGGEEYSIADMAIWPGRNASFVLGADLFDWPATRDWHARIAERPAVRRVLADEKLAPPAKYMGLKQKLDEREWSNMFGEANRAAARRD